MQWLWLTIGGWTAINLGILVWLGWHFGRPTCDWCGRRYWFWSSTSGFPQVFCSYRCNFWDMRDFIAMKAELDIGEVEEMLGRRGWVHPDKLEVAK
jgi:hypothetical protein